MSEIKLTIDEVIEHCRKTCEMAELMAQLRDAEITSKQYWEHKQVAEWLKELKQYRALGTVEELKEAREKQVAKKPIKVKGECYKKDKKGNEHYQTKYLCPYCRKQLLYCGYPCKCGQMIDYNDLSKLDWEEGGTSD